jgi:ubiquinone/menaquinone biosynthesis C-methylase UbiE
MLLDRVKRRSEVKSRRDRAFFEEVSKNYARLVKARATGELRQWIEPRMGKRVLDIGNGEIRNFYSRATKQYTGLDFSLSMLKKEGDMGVEKVCGDALWRFHLKRRFLIPFFIEASYTIWPGKR